MRLKIFDGFLWLFTGIFVITIFFMPQVIPIHWTMDWQIDRYGSRYWMFIFALLPIVVYYGMTLTKKIDPKKENLVKNEKVYRIFQYGLTIFFIVLAFFFEYMIFIPGDGENFILLIMALLFMGMGNYFPKIPQNYFLGIKTPWTLASPIVWNKTHRVAGYCFVILGLMIAIGTFMQVENIYIFMIIVAIDMVIGFYIYSYYLFHKSID